ncbi:MAG: aspartyl/asparaginyl beta-hydroxylase domain-containing protein, partial [Gammaproteobacteria bacterium]|nr:aspartyl/asparaginyl beta-hydroxylase domain-containing protein [Gammaproteobacteria bacterium]
MHDTPQELSRRAKQAVAHGDFAAATELYLRLLNQEPGHIAALSFLAMQAFRQGKHDEALSLLARAIATHPADAVLHQNHGLVLLAAEQFQDAVMALRKALELNPKLTVAHVSLGDALAGMDDAVAASKAYCEAMAQDPELANASHNPDAPQFFRDALARAKSALANGRRLQERKAFASASAEFGGDKLKRVEKLLDAFHGRTPNEFAEPNQQPSWMYLPGLDAQPWFEREKFDWIESIESKTETVRAEYLHAMRMRQGFVSQVTKADNPPAGWEDLADTGRWQTMHLYKHGRPVEENCARCPKTIEILKNLPLVWCRGHEPEIMFSVLAPHTHIPAHYGLTNP